MWADKAKHPEANARNAKFFGERGIDRSPCGTGTSSRMAQLVAKGLLNVGETFVHESLIGTLFHGRVENVSQVAGRPFFRASADGRGSPDIIPFSSISATHSRLGFR